jgi:EAL domain-containing protein (putative c-di-GMP-specific phosphodiesterase class I)/GGDEF domain-containing protein
VDERLAPEVIDALLAFVEQTTDFVGVSDPWGRILYLNPAAQKRLGIIGDTNVTLADLFPAESFAFYYEIVRPELVRHGAWSGEVLVNAAGADAVPMYVSTTAKLGPGGETKGGVVLAHELSRADLAVGVQESEIDSATGLLNRRGFVQRMQVALTASDGSGQACALVLAHVDEVSGSYELQSASTAAIVRRALAGRLTRLARTIDLVGCVDSAELGVFLRGIRSHAEIMRIAQMVQDALVDTPVETPEGAIRASVRCGAAFSKPGDDAEELIRRAAVASVEKASAAPTAIASDERPANVDVPPGLLTIDELRVGMSHGHIWPYAQPVIDLASDDVVGYRGFARWHHRILGVLEPIAWSEMAARSELAPVIDLYVAREVAAAVLVSTREVPLRQYTPASKQLIADVRTEQHLAEIAEVFFLTMHQIHLEVSPATLYDWSRSLDDALQTLREADLSIVLTDVDDVSELERFAHFGFSEVHVTPHLVRHAPTDARARDVLSEIAEFSHARGMLVTALGVDEPMHRDQVVDAGCDFASGDLYGPPEPAKTIG